MRNPRLFFATCAVFAAATACGVTVETNTTDRIYYVTCAFQNDIVKIPFADLDGEAWSVRTKSSGDAVWIFRPSVPSTFSGGYLVRGGQVRLSEKALGAGPIYLNTASANLVNDPNNPPAVFDLTNKVVFGYTSCYAASVTDTSTLRLHSFGFGPSNTTGQVLLGRVSGGASKMALKVDSDASEPVGGFTLQGALDLTLDGGTLKFGKIKGDALFRAGSQATPSLTVSSEGTAIDLAEGSFAKIGYPLAMQSATRSVCRESIQTPSYGFEGGKTTGWTGGYIPGATISDTNPFYLYQNGNSSFMPSNYPEYYTTNGSYFAQLRRQSYMECDVTLPQDGQWQVVFDCGCRPKDDYSKNIPVSVKVDSTLVGEFAAPGVKYVFTRRATTNLCLTAGTHKVRIETGTSSVNYDCIYFDCVRLERYEDETDEGVLNKVGGGRLIVDKYADTSRFCVKEGELVVYPADAGDCCVSVEKGASLVLASENFVVNGSFEKGQSSKDLIQTMEGTGWTRTRVVANEANVSGVGIFGNGGNVAPESVGPLTPEGTQAVALREYTAIWRKVTVPTAGTYRLSFLQACRKQSQYTKSRLLELVASVDGVPVVSNGAFSAVYDYLRQNGEINLDAGEHTVRFEVVNGGYAVGMLLYVDDVRLERTDISLVSPLRVALEAGSSLRLDTAYPVRYLAVSVDGQVVQSRRELKAKGVTVTGVDNVRFGSVRGGFILIR